MLSPNEIHYLVGFLYLHTRRTDVAVEHVATLGLPVQDEAAEKPRDVDVVVARVGTTALVGVEVKAEGRKLDVVHVEQVCQKLADMPSLQERLLVSTSDFTAPARKKAKAHGLRCLRLVQGRLPKIATVDMSALGGMGVNKKSWSPAPRPDVRLLTPKELASDRDVIGVDTTVRFPNGSTMPASRFCDNLATEALAALTVPPGSHTAKVQVNITGGQVLELASGDALVTGAVVTGVAQCEHSALPLEASCYLEDEDGEPFGAAVLTIWDGALFGLMVNEARQLAAFVLPEALRTVRPMRYGIR
jgi:hypothetical protein